MTLAETLSYLGIWSLIGAAIFSAFVVFAFRTDLVYAARKDDGMLKDRIPVRGYLAMVAFLLTIIGFLVLANACGLARRAFSISLGRLFVLNFALYLILLLYDTLVIDGLVLGLWRPAFLQLPDALGWESMKEHMLHSIPVGLAFGVILAGVSAILSFFTVFQ
jgi:hypothetical protein